MSTATTPSSSAAGLGAVAVSGAAEPVVHHLVSAVSASPELTALDLHEQLELLAAVSEPWRHPGGRRHSRVPELLALALGGDWPSRIHAGLTERLGEPVAPHQLPRLEDDVVAVLDGPDARRAAFVTDVVRLLRTTPAR
ncbi:hypothetical protein SAMN06264364_11418 [Quadrisphaera granulorum]|uniref:Uncharacterized protein n=1 Tax=Quadrisphaera granulorum TaxID=317664 RepID=A0A316A6B8_9ACTN|nr:hypothetical protein [Quadrisphaera granulorum]PWJ53123.1 hypothetical protein BXY45_11418 [Quadrisphaera granulorum]SZE97055.1 hypothetical protein SAMN06264364_11418 [Quadrisphaera granulorum]